MKIKWNYFITTAIYFLFLIVLLNGYFMATRNRGLYAMLTHNDAYTSAELDWLSDHDSIAYGETIDALPAQHSPDSTQYQGYSVDIMNMLSIEMGIPANLVPLNWADMTTALDNGTIDLFNATHTKEREEKYALSDPMFKTRGVILVKSSDTDAEQIFQLSGKKIAAINGDYVVDVMRDRIPSVEILLFENLRQCAQALMSGQVNGIAGDEQNIMYYAQQYSLFGEYYVVEEPVYVEEAVMVLRKDERELLSIINKGIAVLERQAIINKLQKKWYVSSLHINQPNPKSVQVLVILFFSGTILYLVVVFTLVNREIKKLVLKRT